MENIDENFEKITALDAEIMNAKMMIRIFDVELNEAIIAENKELAEEYQEKIDKQNERIKRNRAQIKLLNGQIKGYWTPPEKVEEQNIEVKDKSLTTIKKKRWYQYFSDIINLFLEKRKSKKRENVTKSEIEPKIEKNKDFVEKFDPQEIKKEGYNNLTSDELDKNMKGGTEYKEDPERS